MVAGAHRRPHRPPGHAPAVDPGLCRRQAGVPPHRGRGLRAADRAGLRGGAPRLGLLRARARRARSGAAVIARRPRGRLAHRRRLAPAQHVVASPNAAAANVSHTGTRGRSRAITRSPNVHASARMAKISGLAAAPSTHSRAGENSTPRVTSRTRPCDSHRPVITRRVEANHASMTAPASRNAITGGDSPGEPMGHRTTAIRVAQLPAITRNTSVATDIGAKNTASSAAGGCFMSGDLEEGTSRRRIVASVRKG